MSKKAVLVLGVGGIESRDDHLGNEVVRELAPLVDDPEIELMDGGSMGLSVLSHLDRYREVILIGAVNYGGNTGDLLTVKAGDLAGIAPRSPTQRLLRGALAGLEMRDNQPRQCWVFCCQPGVDSPEAPVVPQMVERVLQHLRQRV